MSTNKRFRIFNASAGSGKTFTIVKEFILLLLNNSNPQSFSELLAITFTNKAANEMKGRIIEKLQELKQMPDDHQEMMEYAQNTGLSSHAIRERSAQILSAILHNYGLFAVSTIDKFNLRLMRSFSQDMGLSVNFDVEMNTTQLITESVDLLFSELHENPLLSAILRDIALENLANDERWDISDEVVAQTNNLLEDKFLNQMKNLQQISLENFNQFRVKVNQNFFNAKNAISQTADEAMKYFSDQNLSVNDFKGKSRGSVFKIFQNFQSGKLDFATAPQLKMLEEKDYLNTKNIAHELVYSTIDQLYERIKQNLTSYYFWDKIRKKVKSISIVNEVEKRLQLLKNDNNILLIGDLNKIISENIKDQPAPFIYEKIGNRYQHYFIDEFQDTSTLQWNNINPLIENALAEDQTILLVGDPKQSIYRFRGGNPDLMLELSQSENTEVEVKTLETNWRSYDQVIQFNNDLYHFISTRLNDDESYQKLYQDSYQKPNHKTGGFVQLKLLKRPVKGSGERFIDRCLENLLQDIRHAERHGFFWHEMAVLVRKNSESREVAEFLSRNNYQVISGDSLLLKNSDNVKLMIAAIQYLNDTTWAENKVNLLLNLFHVGKLPTEDITTLIINSLKWSQVELFIELKKYGLSLDAALQPFQSFYDQVSSALRAFGLDKDGDAYITFFMDEVLKFQNTHDPSAKGFIEYWELYAQKLSIVIPDGQKAIQLLTIHKSKGLQFPVVFLPFTYWASDTSTVWIPVEDETVSEFMIDDFKNTDFFPDAVKEKIDEEKLQSSRDVINEFYVATTRAEEQMYITSEWHNKSKDSQISEYLNNFFNLKFSQNSENQEIIENLYESNDSEIQKLAYGIPARCSEIKEDKNQIHTSVNFISSDWRDKIQISKEHQLLWNTTRAQAIDYGNKMHAVLEKMNQPDDIEDILKTFELHGFIETQNKARLQNELNQLFNHEKLQEVFNSNDFLSERDFIDRHGRVFRPDRLVKIGESWVILDYKTGEHQQKHITQLQYYAEELNFLGFPVHQKFLIYPGNDLKVVEIV
ncbi:MAG: UvrD-helicase domain-containing protein [Flavobacteriaceae bacterium]|nr:UvrD-helicase domain-containing protein [Flavobacteriaceae bacterium]